MRALLTRFRHARLRWRIRRLHRWADALLRDACYHRSAASEHDIAASQYTSRAYEMRRRAERLRED